MKNLENLRQHYTQQDAETKKQLQKKFPKKPLSQINEASVSRAPQSAPPFPSLTPSFLARPWTILMMMVSLLSNSGRQTWNHGLTQLKLIGIWTSSFIPGNS